MSDHSSKPFFSITVFTLKPGRLDDFIAARMQGALRLAEVPGLTQSRFYREEDGARAVLAAGFESPAAFEAFRNSVLFQEERARLLPFIEEAQRGGYRLIQERVPTAD